MGPMIEVPLLAFLAMWFFTVVIYVLFAVSFAGKRNLTVMYVFKRTVFNVSLYNVIAWAIMIYPIFIGKYGASMFVSSFLIFMYAMALSEVDRKFKQEENKKSCEAD